MTVLLGVDTGGTYTDAVLVEDDETVLASAKSLTTRNDLAQGIGASVAVVVERAGIDPASIAMAALSTTLATNALVEGHGGRVALVYIGFNKKDLATHGLTDALAGDPSIVLDGGHTHAGAGAAPLDCAALSVWIASLVGCRPLLWSVSLAPAILNMNLRQPRSFARLPACRCHVRITCRQN